jgi:eukaryotic-like serine/threonine-protein kinase
MPLAEGTRLGPYEIASRIGAGGMGEVWRASDTRIGRDVAIKVLPPDFATDAERLRRFEQEARAAGSLNHPNLVTVHELGADHLDAPYIVMELLEGTTLRERLSDGAGGRMPVRKALELGVQIASGLAAAHEKGIVHRDLKPENIFITRDGRAKILDFGLARRSLPPSSDSTTQHRNTAPGSVLGTAGYMSPEQVRGHPVDNRSDIFSLGSILYEMLAGRPAFRQNSAVETMNAVLTADTPDISSPDHRLSPPVEHVVHRCLEKDREERFQSARDVAFALEAVTGSTSETSAVAAPAGMRSRSFLFAVAAAVILASIAAGFVLGSGKRNTTPMFSARQLTFDAGLESGPSLAPSGDLFAFVRDGDIFVQRTDGRNAINLTNSADVREGGPAFSPDGRQIAFHLNGPGTGIFVMGATGESIRRMTSSGFDPAWSPDGKQLVWSADEEGEDDPRGRITRESRLWVVDLPAGEPRLLLDRDAMQPSWSPGGERIAYWAYDDAGQRDIFTVSSRGGANTVVPLTDDAAIDWSPVWSPDGRWIYFSSDRSGTMSIWRVAVDERSGRRRGSPEPVGAPAEWAGPLSMSADGRHILFQTRSVTNSLHRARFDTGSETLTIDPSPALAGSLLAGSASASPDGEWIAFTTEGREDVFVMRADGSDRRQLTEDDHRDRGATWTPDGERILFYSTRSGSYQVWSIRPDGSGLTALTNLSGGVSTNYPLVSPDGRWMASVTINGDWFIFDLSQPPTVQPEFLPKIPGTESGLWAQSWSPDGRQLAGVPFIGRREVWIYSVADGAWRPAGKGSRVVWVDQHRLLIEDGETFSVHDLRSGARREVARSPLRLAGRVWVAPEHLVLRSLREEGDVWLMTRVEN